MSLAAKDIKFKVWALQIRWWKFYVFAPTRTSYDIKQMHLFCYSSACFSERENHNTVYGIVRQAGVMFLGNFQDDVEQCKEACAQKPDCISYR